MTHVGTWSGGSQVAVPAQAGDWLLAVVSVDSGVLSSLAVQMPGWQRVGAESLLVAGEIGRGPNPDLLSWMGTMRWMSLWVRRADGPLVASAQIPGTGRDARMVVVAYRSVRELGGASSLRVNRSLASWPAVPHSLAGDVVRVALGWDVTPAGHTRRAAGISDVASSQGAPDVRTNEYVDGWSWTVLFTAGRTVPAPVLVVPGAVSTGVPVEVSWQPVADVTHRMVRARLDGGAWSYLTAAGGWQSGEVWLAGSGSSATLPALAGGLWEVQARLQVNPDVGDWSTPVAVLVSAPPGQPGVAVSSWATRRPVITVTGSAGAGSTLSGYRITVPVLLADGTIGSETVVDADGVWQPTRLPDGPVTIQARIVQNGSQLGPVRSVSGSVAIAPIPVPQVTQVTLTHGVSGLPGLRLFVEADVAGRVIEVEKDGRIVADLTLDGTSEVVDDYVPADSYRVRAGDGSGEWSPWVDVSATEGDQAGWLYDPLRPELAVKLTAREEPGLTYPIAARSEVVIDRAYRHVSYGQALRPDGVTSVWVGEGDDPSLPEYDKAVALLTSQATLVYQWCPSTEGEPGRRDVFRIVDDIVLARLIPNRNINVWAVTFNWASARETI